MSDLVRLQIGDRIILVTPEDAENLDQDLHLFGSFHVHLAEGGGRYVRINPADIMIHLKRESDESH